ncbi:MAG: hypothetical protein M1450_04150 [Patescibacteria group bacterium]|nr:hypothetical protein [Patescibacteria group bacterium]
MTENKKTIDFLILERDGLEYHIHLPSFEKSLKIGAANRETKGASKPKETRDISEDLKGSVIFNPRGGLFFLEPQKNRNIIYLRDTRGDEFRGVLGKEAKAILGFLHTTFNAYVPGGIHPIDWAKKNPGFIRPTAIYPEYLRIGA